MPNRFARQFGYDQLYVGNPNAKLSFSGNLFEGAQAWYYSMARGTKAIFSLPHKTPNCYTSLSFCTGYSQASKMPGFLINISCIKSIKASYKDKLASNKRVRGMKEYQAAEKEAGGETVAGPRAAAPKEHPAKKSRQAVSKRSHGSTSKSEPIPKKARREPEAGASMPEVVSSGIEGQREEEEEEEEIPLLLPRGLCNRGPMILEEGELADEPATAEETERPEVDLIGRDDVEIPGVSSQPGSSSVQEKRDEVQ